MTVEDLQQVEDAFIAAVERSEKAGCKSSPIFKQVTLRIITYLQSTSSKFIAHTAIYSIAFSPLSRILAQTNMEAKNSTIASVTPLKSSNVADQPGRSLCLCELVLVTGPRDQRRLETNGSNGELNKALNLSRSWSLWVSTWLTAAQAVTGRSRKFPFIPDIR